jgi:hypothetical protein
MSHAQISNQSEDSIDWSFLTHLNTPSTTKISKTKPKRQCSKTKKPTVQLTVPNSRTIKSIQTPPPLEPAPQHHTQRRQCSHHNSIASIKTSARMMEIRMMLKSIKKQEARLQARLAKVRSHGHILV